MSPSSVRIWVRQQPPLRKAFGGVCLVALVVGVVAAIAVRLAPANGHGGVANTGASAVTGSAVTSPATAPETTTTETVTSTTTAQPATTVAEPTTTTVPLVPADGRASSERRLVSAFTVSNADLQPKSIVASGNGLFFAQNMMYRHNMMVFDRTGNLVAKISDKVDLASFGVAGGVVAKGAPVEAAFTPDGSSIYVSNYKMYGPGFNPVADDNCNRGKWDDSFVYKINTSTFTIDKVIATGAVPKFMAVTPDGARLLVSNWCGFDVSIIDTASDTPITRISVGRHPRGIAITNDSRYAYVAVMGENKIDVIDLSNNTVINTVADPGQTPRHLVLSPDDRYLYVSNNHQNLVRKIDLQLGAEVGTASTGTEPRSMAISDDGASLYVVNYQDGTVSKVRTSDMRILQTERSGVRPVGITYDAPSRQVWVANYSGSLHVFTDS
jgi:YVTN family beta-propeller protein